MKPAKPSLSRRLRLVILSLGVGLLSACTQLVFQPMKPHVLDPRRFGVVLEDLSFAGDDGTELHGWFLPARQNLLPDGQARGTVIFLHGNAENISTHINSVHWLPQHGYHVYAYDYRGFGKSAGVADYDWARRDLLTAIRFIQQHPPSQSQPLFVFGQSLGGAIALSTLGQHPLRLELQGLIVEGSPSSLRDIAREVLAAQWISWPLQYPLSWLIDDTASPIEQVAGVAPLRLLIAHSRDDRVIPFHHGARLKDAAGPDARFLELQGRHIAGFAREDTRADFLRFLAN